MVWSLRLDLWSYDDPQLIETKGQYVKAMELGRPTIYADGDDGDAGRRDGNRLWPTKICVTRVPAPAGGPRLPGSVPLRTPYESSAAVREGDATAERGLHRPLEGEVDGPASARASTTWPGCACWPACAVASALRRSSTSTPASIGSADDMVSGHGEDGPDLFAGPRSVAGDARVTVDDLCVLSDAGRRAGPAVPTWWCWCRRPPPRIGVRAGSAAGPGRAGPVAAGDPRPAGRSARADDGTAAVEDAVHADRRQRAVDPVGAGQPRRAYEAAATGTERCDRAGRAASRSHLAPTRRPRSTPSSNPAAAELRQRGRLRAPAAQRFGRPGRAQRLGGELVAPWSPATIVDRGSCVRCSGRVRPPAVVANDMVELPRSKGWSCAVYRPLGRSPP